MHRHNFVYIALLFCLQSPTSCFDLLDLYPNVGIRYMGLLDTEHGSVVVPDQDGLTQTAALLFLAPDGGEIIVKVSDDETKAYTRIEGSLDYILIMNVLEATQQEDLTPLPTSDENTFKHTLSNDLVFIVLPGDIAKKLTLTYQAGGCDLRDLPEYVDKEKTHCQFQGKRSSRFSTCQVQCLRQYKLNGDPNIKCVKGKFYPSRPCGLMPWHVNNCRLLGKCVYSTEELERYYAEKSEETGEEMRELNQVLPGDTEAIAEKDIGGTSLAVVKKSSLKTCKGTGYCQRRKNCRILTSTTNDENHCYLCKKARCSKPMPYN